MIPLNNSSHVCMYVCSPSFNHKLAVVAGWLLLLNVLLLALFFFQWNQCNPIILIMKH